MCLFCESLGLMFDQFQFYVKKDVRMGINFVFFEEIRNKLEFESTCSKVLGQNDRPCRSFDTCNKKIEKRETERRQNRLETICPNRIGLISDTHIIRYFFEKACKEKSNTARLLDHSIFNAFRYHYICFS